MNKQNDSFLADIRPTLVAGGTIGIVSPATWDGTPTYERLEGLRTFWESRGHPVYVHPQNYLKYGVFAGTDSQRAQAFMDMVVNPEIGAIACVRGGTGSIHLLDLLDYKLIQNNPKPVIGFSDITVLLHAITKRCGIVTYYGPMGYNFTNPKNDPRTCEDLITALNPKQDGYEMAYEVGCLREGTAEGILIGGHMNRMQLLLGTPFDCLPSGGKKIGPVSQPVILFIETVETTRLEIDNILRQFNLAGKFQNVRGVIIGEMFDIQDGQTSLARADEMSYGHGLPAIIAKHMDTFPDNIPIVNGFPCGHGHYLSTMPIGASVRLTASKKTGAKLAFAPL